METDLTGFEFAQNPYSFYNELRKTGNVHYLKSTNNWLVTGYPEIQEILTNFTIFTSEGAHSFDPILLNCDPPAHTLHRKVLTSENGLFAPGRIDNLEAQNRAICKGLISQLGDKESFDLLSDFAMPYSALVILNLLGINPESTSELKKWSEGAMLNKSIYNTEFANRQWDELKPIVEGWIDDAKKQGSSFGIAALFINPEAGFLDRESLLNLTKVLLLGGNETTPNLLSSAFLLLMKKPELLLAIASNPELIQDFLFEVLRLESPAQIIQRINKTAVTINGKTIPANSNIALAIGAANRDPRIFTNPDAFDLQREKAKILSFGYGPHYCIGATLAKQQAQIAIEEILKRFPLIGLSKHYYPVYRHSSHIRGLESMELYAKRSLLENLDQLRESAFELLQNTLKERKHFATFENYPKLDENTWHYTYPSPFIHANVMYSLLNLKGFKNASIAEQGKQFLLQTKETNDTWRFWKLNNCRNPVPPDVDDTAICSFVLHRLGINTSGKELLYRNLEHNGRIKTWIMPGLTLLFRHPSFATELYRQRKLTASSFKAQMLNANDSELGVMANVLLHLGESAQTKTAIDYCISTWQNKTDSKNFYDHDLVIAYHIARAFHEGITGFWVLRGAILNDVATGSDQTKTPELLLSYLIARYYKDDTLRNRIKSIILRRIAANGLSFEPFRYFTSKDRNFYGGSACLTAAWFLEVTDSW